MIDRSQYKRLPKDFFTRDRSNVEIPEHIKQGKGLFPLIFVYDANGELIRVEAAEGKHEEQL